MTTEAACSCWFPCNRKNYVLFHCCDTLICISCFKRFLHLHFLFMLFCPVGQVKRPESIDQKGYSQLAAWGMTDGASRTGCVPVEAGVHRKITFRYFSSGAVTVPSEPLMCKLAQKGHKNRDRTWMKAAVLHVNLHNVTLMRDSVQKSNRKIHDSLSCRF